jgi:hypothetical protein
MIRVEIIAGVPYRNQTHGVIASDGSFSRFASLSEIVTI